MKEGGAARSAWDGLPAFTGGGTNKGGCNFCDAGVTGGGRNMGGASLSVSTGFGGENIGGGKYCSLFMVSSVVVFCGTKATTG